MWASQARRSLHSDPSSWDAGDEGGRFPLVVGRCYGTSSSTHSRGAGEVPGGGRGTWGRRRSWWWW